MLAVSTSGVWVGVPVGVAGCCGLGGKVSGVLAGNFPAGGDGASHMALSRIETVIATPFFFFFRL